MRLAKPSIEDRKVKSISFSMADPYEAAILQHSEQFQNFSRYVKRLIQRDMEGSYLPSRFRK